MATPVKLRRQCRRRRPTCLAAIADAIARADSGMWFSVRSSFSSVRFVRSACSCEGYQSTPRMLDPARQRYILQYSTPPRPPPLRGGDLLAPGGGSRAGSDASVSHSRGAPARNRKTAAPSGGEQQAKLKLPIPCRDTRERQPGWSFLHATSPSPPHDRCPAAGSIRLQPLPARKGTPQLSTILGVTVLG